MGSITKNPGEDQFLKEMTKFINQLPGINYIIDKEYNLISYNTENWNKSAKTSGGDELLESDNLLKQSIFEFMEGERVKQFYKTAYQSLFKKSQREIKIDSLDDAPDMLRDNVIYLSPITSPETENVVGILHHSLIIRSQPRPAFDGQEKEEIDPSKFVEICSICKFVHIQGENRDEWIGQDEYYRLGGSGLIKLQQSICSDCAKILDDFI